MSKTSRKIKKFQGANRNWFISINNKIICGSRHEFWIDKFLEVVKKEENQ